MRTAVWILLLAVLTVASAAGDVPAATGCDDSHQLLAFAGDPAFDDACTAFKACLALAQVTPCKLYFFAERLAACATDDLICRAQARLHAGLIGLTEGRGHSIHADIPEWFWRGMTTRISDELETASFNQAAAWYLPLIESYRTHPMIDYSFAVIAMAKQIPETAGDFLESARGLGMDDPLIYWARGDFFASSGASERAAAEYLMLKNTAAYPVASDALETALAARESYRINTARAQAYIEYALTRTAAGINGANERNLSADGIPRTLLPVGESMVILSAGDTSPVLSIGLLQLGDIALEKHEQDWLEARGESLHDGPGIRLRLWPRPDGGYTGQRDYILPAGLMREEFILMPADGSNPRADIFRCPNTPIPLLAPGMTATVIQDGAPLLLYLFPEGETPIEVSADDFVVEEGPLCGQGRTWYSVRSPYFTGWIIENSGPTTYAVTVR